MRDSLFLIELGGVVLLLAILSRIALRFGFSPIPLYLLAGLAFGQGGSCPLSPRTSSSRRGRRSA